MLQAYLPDALSAMMRLQEWAAARRASGGAAIKVRIVKGANLPMEQVEASLHGWPLATWGTKQETDTNYKRVVDYALHPDRIDNVRIGVAGPQPLRHRLRLAARQAARRRRDGIEFEMLLGMAQGQAEAVRKDVGALLLYTPVVHPQEFDVAIAYLIRRLEEGASQRRTSCRPCSSSARTRRCSSARSSASWPRSPSSTTPCPAPNRTQDRQLPAAAAPTDGFDNTPDTDPPCPPTARGAARSCRRVAGVAARRRHRRRIDRHDRRR